MTLIFLPIFNLKKIKKERFLVAGFYKKLFEIIGIEVDSLAKMSARQKFIHLLSTEIIKLDQAIAKYERDAFEASNNNFKT